jgi:hypothetical protein
VTITDMSFDTEEVHKHPFMFEDEELTYRTQQYVKRLNPDHFVGLRVVINVDGVKREGIIYTYVLEYKAWHVVLTANKDDESPNVYVTLSQLADENKVLFQEKLKVDTLTVKKEGVQHKCVSKDIDLNFVKLQRMYVYI